MVRVAAWQILRSGSTTPMRLVDREASRSGFDSRDRGLLRQLVGTELRRRSTLRAIVKRFTRRPAKPDMVAHYHLGLVQLLFLDRIPHHAAVSTTVDAVRRTLGGSKTANANGFLRAVIRARAEGFSGDPRCDFTWREEHFDVPVFRDYDTQPLLWAEDALSMPASIMKRWAKRHGREQAFAMARTFTAEPPLSVRVVRGDRDSVMAELELAGCESFPGEHESILICPSDQTGTVISSPAFIEGRITIQGETALRAAELLEAQSGERILDMCAA
ncbi:MAG: 16S rRNA (cytosine967-C5)-methyltransferase, partial [Planctomycetota bacterium]